MANNGKFRLNQYNWLGQKFLVQHRYSDIIRLRNQRQATSSDGQQLICSDHLSYLSGLAIIKTSTHLDEIIFTLQRLNFQKDNQYFLLLCQCLLYLGNHDSVVELCKQIFNREINTTTTTNTNIETIQTHDQDEILKDDANNLENNSRSGCYMEEFSNVNSIKENPSNRRKLGHKGMDWCLKNVSCDESLEFRSAFESVNSNPLINDARLWFIFALCLEFQLQLKDADLAYRMASKLACGSSFNERTNRQNSNTNDDNQSSSQQTSSPMSNYHLPHIRYAEFCIRYRNNYKLAIKTLCQLNVALSSTANSVLDQAKCVPIDYQSSPLLALIISSQPQASSNHFEKSLSILQALDMHSISTRNPSADYNRLARLCKHKLLSSNCSGSLTGATIFDQQSHELGSSGNNFAILNHNELGYNLEFALIKSHLIINNLVQQSDKLLCMYKCPKIIIDRIEPKVNKTAREKQLVSINGQMDKLIEHLKTYDSTCWSVSASLWNNLGICYLIKRRLVASLSCLTRAHQMNPLDWRINFNLALVSAHTKLSHRALVCSLASNNLYQHPHNKTDCMDSIIKERIPITCVYNHDIRSKRQSTLIKTLLATCFIELRVPNEARRQFAEMLAKSTRLSATTPTPSVWLIVNYLLFLSGILSNSTSEQQHNQSQRFPIEQAQTEKLDHLKLIGHLLDYLEQIWLRRSQNDCQFNVELLELAGQIGEIWLSSKHADQLKTNWRKKYAWIQS